MHFDKIWLVSWLLRNDAFILEFARLEFRSTKRRDGCVGPFQGMFLGVSPTLFGPATASRHFPLSGGGFMKTPTTAFKMVYTEYDTLQSS
jgi:hypothetical protein